MVITMVALMVKGKEYIDLMGNNSSWIIACTVVAFAFIMVFISSVGILGTFVKNTSLMKMVRHSKRFTNAHKNGSLVQYLQVH